MPKELIFGILAVVISLICFVGGCQVGKFGPAYQTNFYTNWMALTNLTSTTNTIIVTVTRIVVVTNYTEFAGSKTDIRTNVIRWSVTNG